MKIPNPNRNITRILSLSHILTWARDFEVIKKNNKEKESLDFGGSFVVYIPPLNPTMKTTSLSSLFPHDWKWPKRKTYGSHYCSLTRGGPKPSWIFLYKLPYWEMGPSSILLDLGLWGRFWCLATGFLVGGSLNRILHLLNH